MKSKDINYIIKRIIIGVAIGLILMLSKNVFASSYSLTPSTCYLYYNNGSTNVSGSVGSLVAPGNFNVSTCTTSTARYFVSTRYDVTFNQNVTGTGSIIFSVSDTTNEITSVVVVTGSREYPCDLITGAYLTNSSNSSPTGNRFYTSSCSNVPISQNRLYQIKIFKYDKTGLSSTTNGSWVSRDFVFTLNDSSAITSSIDNQTQQQHQDSQDTQNAINGVNNSINSSVTPSGSDTNSAYTNFEGATAQNGVITSLITLPISLFTNILTALNSSCTRFDIGTLLGTHIYFNCINPGTYIGNQVWSVIDVLLSGYFVWYMSRKLIKVFENLSSLKEGDPVGD